MESIPQKDDVSVVAGTARRHVAAGEGTGRSLFSRSDSEILDLVSATHVPDHPQEHTSSDVSSLLSTTKDIIVQSNEVISDILGDLQPSDIKSSSSTSETRCKISYEGSSDEIALESRTLETLGNLSKYSWGLKALLVLADFALEYEESYQLGKSVAILKEVPNPNSNPTNLKKRQEAVVQLDSLMTGTLNVVKFIFALPKNPSLPLDVPSMKTAVDNIPVSVFWSIITVVACENQVARLASEEEKPHDLSQFSSKIDQINGNLLSLIGTIHSRPRRSTYMTMAESMEVLTERIFSEDNTQTVLIDGSTNNPVPVDVLSYNNLLLFFSSLTNISDADIEALKIVNEGIKTYDKTNIVWIPVVEQWTDELRNNFEILRWKMPWYIVQCSSTLKAGNDFIEEEWNFKGKPVVVVMNKQGTVKNLDALPIIREQGMKAWPFHKRHGEKLKPFLRKIKFW